MDIFIFFFYKKLMNHQYFDWENVPIIIVDDWHDSHSLLPKDETLHNQYFKFLQSCLFYKNKILHYIVNPFHLNPSFDFNIIKFRFYSVYVQKIPLKM